jgi:hypothetical protein
MHVSDVEAEPALRPRGDSTALRRRRQREQLEVVVVVPGVLLVVVAPRRPQDHVAQDAGVGIEEPGLILGVGPVVVGVVAEHQEHVRLRRRAVLVLVPHRDLVRPGQPAVPEDPDPHRARHPGRRSGTEPGSGISTRDLPDAIADGVPVLRVRSEPGETDLVRGPGDRIGLGAIEHPFDLAELDHARHRDVGAPSNGHPGLRTHLQIRATGHRRRRSRHGRQEQHGETQDDSSHWSYLDWRLIAARLRG